MTESTVGWFGVREKYCSLADKPWLISQIRPKEHAVGWLDGEFNTDGESETSVTRNRHPVRLADKS